MAVQSYLVGVFFLVGIVAGVVVSYIVSSFTGNSVFIASSAIQLKEAREASPGVTDSPLHQDPHSRFFRGPLSHEEINQAPVPDRVQEFKDELYHKGTLSSTFYTVGSNTHI